MLSFSSFAVIFCLAISCATLSLALRKSASQLPAGLALVALGGYGPHYDITQDVDIISTASNAHTSGSAIPIRKFAFGSAVMNNTIFIVGGVEPSRNASSTLAYNVAANTWTTLQSFPLEVSENAVVAVNNTLYSLGGFATGYGSMNYTYKYDLTAQTWTKMPTLLPFNYAISCAVTTPSGSIYLWIAGRYMYRTDDGAQSWIQLHSSTGTRWSTSCAFLPQRNAIMLAGSRPIGSTDEVPANSTEFYDIGTNTWKQGPSLAKARGLAGAAVIPGSDNVVVCGGEGKDETDVNTDCELYDAAENQWKTTNFALNMPRYSFGFFAVQN